MKIIEFHTRIMKIIEILNNQLANKTNHENLEISYENHENYENPGIPFENNEIHDFFRISCENHKKYDYTNVDPKRNALQLAFG